MNSLREYINIIAEATDGPVPYFVDVSSGKPMARTGGSGPTAIVASTKWPAITPEIIARAEPQGFRLVRLQYNGQLVQGLEGGDMKLGSKILVSAGDYAKLKSPPAGQ